MLKKIDINLGYGGWTKIWAWVDGVYAIHRLGEGWGLTHVPTGMGIARDYYDASKSHDKESVLKMLDKYKRLRWRGMNPLENLEPCELLNLAQLIHEELRGTEFNPYNIPISSDEWLPIQTEAAEALACKIEEKL